MPSTTAAASTRIALMGRGGMNVVTSSIIATDIDTAPHIVNVMTRQIEFSLVVEAEPASFGA